MKIKYFKNKNIDRKRWDEAIDKASNGRIYGYSWYLDILCENWDALVVGDYEYIMPLPWKSKYGIKYIYMPLFIQQLGIYAEKEFESDLYATFLQKIPQKFKLIDLNLNADNFPSISGAKLKRRTNFVLDLNRPYSQIAQNYERSARQALKKTFEYEFTEYEDIEKIIIDYTNINEDVVSQIEQQHRQLFILAAQKAKELKKLFSYTILDINKKPLVSHILFFSHNRYYFIAGSQTEESKRLNANDFFFDEFFKKHCDENSIFDFEGSDIPGVATFFKKWGSVPEYYTNIQIKRFPVNLFK